MRTPNHLTVPIEEEAQYEICTALTSDNPTKLAIDGVNWTGFLADYRDALALIARHAASPEHRQAGADLLAKVSEARHSEQARIAALVNLTPQVGHRVSFEGPVNPITFGWVVRVEGPRVAVRLDGADDGDEKLIPSGQFVARDVASGRAGWIIETEQHPADNEVAARLGYCWECGGPHTLGADHLSCFTAKMEA